MKNNTKKILITILIILLSPVFIYLIVDGKNLYIDMYNFRQLGKVKDVLKDYKKENNYFNNVKQFNEIYKTNIKAIKNCYDISNYNGSEEYIFGFKLESYIYIYIYGTEYYAYPKYDIPYQNVCMGGLGACEDEPEGIKTPYSQAKCEYGECYDGNRRAFENVISNPCRD